MSVFIVIAHYNEDLSYITNFKYPYEVISKKGIPQETIPNKGNEASSFLQYIIENYDNLSDYTIFIHAHRTSPHNFGNIDEQVNHLKFKYDYENINNASVCSLTQHPPSFNKMLTIFPKIEHIIGKIDLYNLHFKGCAQFYVKKDAIHRQSLQVYKDLYKWLMETDEISFWSGRVFEYIWGLLFTGSLDYTI